MKKTIGVIIAALSFVIQSAEIVLQEHKEWRYWDFAVAGVFFGLALYTNDRRRFYLGMLVCGLTIVFGLVNLNKWWVIAIWIAIAFVASLWLREKEPQSP